MEAIASMQAINEPMRGKYTRPAKYHFTTAMDEKILNFVVHHVGIIDFRKVDKFWLVDILTGRNSLDVKQIRYDEEG